MIIKMRCAGETPLLSNRPTDEFLENLRQGLDDPRPKYANRQEEAEKKLHISDGRIGLPTENFLRCLMGAARLVKVTDKRTISAKFSPLASFLHLDPHFLAFNKKQQSWKIDVRDGRDTKTGEKVKIVRPRFDSWGFSASVEFDQTKLSEAKVRELIETAGSKVGLGDFRPGLKRGPFGKFKIKSWRVISRKYIGREVEEN